MRRQVRACVGKLEAEPASSAPLVRARIARALGLLDLGHGQAVRSARPTPVLDQHGAPRVKPVGRARRPGRGRGRRSRSAAGRREEPLRSLRTVGRAVSQPRPAGATRTVSRARGRAPTQTAITPRPSSLPTRCRRSSERAPSSYSGSGFAATGGASTPAATYALHWQRSSNTPRRHGQTARAASCAPAARAPANATPPRETNSHLRSSISPASPPTGSRTPRSEPSSSSAPARSTTT